MLMDSEGERFYLKSADASGMPLPLRVFEYKERTETAQQTAGGSVAAFDDLDNKFVTRDEFERRMASIAQQKKGKNKLTEDTEDGDATI
jgi:nitrous oxide reductase accessory protein NosL